nr:HdeD family acid-resistance protein [uncultured Rhodopila sp.]
MAIGSLPQTGFPSPMNAELARHWWLIALRGVIALLFGLIALTAPGAALLSLALIFGAYLLVDGIAGLYVAWRASRVQAPWGALLGEAVLNIIMGLIALVMPVAAVYAFVILLSIWALITGGLMVAAAFRLHSSHGRWWLALGGVASLVWGALLAAAPMIGAVVVAWWLGIYAIIFGAALLACAWRLRAQRTGVSGNGAVRI